MILINGICITIPCSSIPNCQYCFRSTNCLVCKQGYILNSNGQCINNTQNINCSINFNPFCTGCSSTACTACAVGYTLMNGQCLCSITNCNLCIGNAFCY